MGLQHQCAMRFRHDVRWHKITKQQYPFMMEIMQSALTGYYVMDPMENEHFLYQLSGLFKFYPKVLNRVLKILMQHDEGFKTVVLASVFDLHKLQGTLKEQLLDLKKGGGISNRLWDQVFSPTLQKSVCFAHN